MPVNTWIRAARGALEGANVSESFVAKKWLGVNRAALSPYLSGARTPNRGKLLRINRAIAKATKGGRRAVAYLNLEAVAAELLPWSFLDQGAMVSGARVAMGELCAGSLVPGWEHRFVSTAQSWDEKKIADLLLALNREHQRLLRSTKRVPWKTGLDAMTSVLRDAGLGALIAKRSRHDPISQFQNTVKKELRRVLNPVASAHAVYVVESRILAAALALNSPGNSPLAQLLTGGSE